MHVAGTQYAPFEIAELVEYEERVVTRAAEVPIPNAHLLIAVRRAHARIHVQHDLLGCPAPADAVDPLAGEIDKCAEMPRRREPLRFKATHLTR